MSVLAKLGKGLIAGGTAAMAPQEADASFLGQAAKGASKFMLGVAEKMKATGIDPAEIWQKTGWGEGVDGKWRFEVDDNPAGIKGKELYPGDNWSVSDIYESSPIEGRYPTGTTSPQYENLTIGRANKLESAGSYSPYSDHIAVQPSHRLKEIPPKELERLRAMRKGSEYKKAEGQFLEEMDKIDESLPIEEYKTRYNLAQTTFNQNPSVAEYKSAEKQLSAPDYNVNEDDASTTLHEIQHAIQEREGFARGGSPKQFEKTDENITKGKWAGIILDSVDSENQLEKVIKEAEQEVLGRHYTDNKYGAADIDVIRQLKESNSRQALLDRWRAESRSTEDSFSSYKRLAGETEARNVQTRMNMSQSERRNTPPWTTEDVPRSDQIARMGGMAGFGASGGYGQTEASTQPSAITELLDNARNSQEVGSIRNVPNPNLYKLGDLIDQYTEIPGVGPAFEGVTDWMRESSEDRDEGFWPKYKRGVWAGLDVVP